MIRRGAVNRKKETILYPHGDLHNERRELIKIKRIESIFVICEIKYNEMKIYHNMYCEGMNLYNDGKKNKNISCQYILISY